MAEKGEVQRGEIEKVPARRSLLVERVIEPVVEHLGWKAAVGPVLVILAAACSQGGDEVTPLKVSQPPTTRPVAGQQIEKHPTIEATVRPAKVKEPALTSSFGLIRQKVEAGSASGEQKQQLLAIVDKFEKTSQVVDQMMVVYGAQKEPDGTPTLLALKKKQLGNLDLRLFYPHLSQEEALTKWAETELFFTRDQVNIKGLLAYRFNNLENFPNLASELERFNSQFDSIFSINYLEVGTLSLTKNELPIKVDPNVEENPRLASKVAEIRQTVASISPKVPHRPDLTIYIRESGRAEFDVAGKLINLPVGGVSLGIEGYSEKIEETVAHEFGHGLDIALDVKILAKYLSPEQFVQLLIIREKIVAGGWQPKVEQIFAPEKAEVFGKWQTGQKLTPKDLEILTAIESDRRLFVDPHGGFDIFDKEIAAETIMQFSRLASKSQTYGSLEEFLAQEAGKIESLAVGNQLLADIIGDIRARPEVYDKYWESIWPPKQVSGSSQKGWWSAFVDMARVRALELAFDGKLDLSPEKLERLEDYQQEIAAEIFATSLAQTIILGDRLADPAKTPSWQYLQFLAR